MHYLCDENEGADQLCSYCTADLRLCFSICKNLVFSCNHDASGCITHPGFIEDRASTNHEKTLFLLAHLSRRLIGELIGYSWSGVRPLFVCRSQCSKIFFSKTAWPIKAKFYVEPPWVGGTKVCSRHVGHMTKMATTPIYGKNPSKIFSRTDMPIFKKLGM